MSTEKSGAEPPSPPPHYDQSEPPMAYPSGEPSTIQPGQTQPQYVTQTYVPPQPTPGQPQVTIQLTNTGQPGVFQIPPQTDSSTLKKLNLAGVILSAIILGVTVLGLIVGPVEYGQWSWGPGREYSYHGSYHMLIISSIVGSIGGVFLVIGMIMSCVTAFSKSGNKRAMLTAAIVMYCIAGIGALFLVIGMIMSCTFFEGHNPRAMLIATIVMYSIAVCLLVAWVLLNIDLHYWMLVFLICAFGCLALAIISGIACSKYSSKNVLVMYSNAPQPVVMGTAPQPVVVGNPGQPVYVGQHQVTYQPMVMGAAPQQMVMGGAPQQMVVGAAPQPMYVVNAPQAVVNAPQQAVVNAPLASV